MTRFPPGQDSYAQIALPFLQKRATGERQNILQTGCKNSKAEGLQEKRDLLSLPRKAQIVSEVFINQGFSFTTVKMKTRPAM